MTELDSRCLDAFPQWLRSLGDDARDLAALLDNDQLAEPVRKHCAAALNYLFKSLDLIPDGIEDLGFVDDAFVFRVASANALERDAGAADADGSGTLKRLAEDAGFVSEFLGDTYVRLSRFVDALENAVVRGRTVAAIVGEASVRSQFVGEVKGWAGSYQAPSFSRDEKNLVKLRSFMAAKLPE
jgi:uncharacterized membrane protein YkvA (DUF1232 family)